MILENALNCPVSGTLESKIFNASQIALFLIKCALKIIHQILCKRDENNKMNCKFRKEQQYIYSIEIKIVCRKTSIRS